MPVLSRPDTSQWNVLVAEMLATGRFRKERLEQSGFLEDLYRSGCSVILPALDQLHSRAKIYAHVARLETKDSGWQEISMAYVDNDHTRNGYLGQIVRELLERAPPDLNFFGITKDPAVMRVFHRKGLVPVTTAVEPHIKAWAKTLGIPKKVLPKTALLETEPDLDRILKDAAKPKTARRWLWKQVEQT